MKRRVWFVAAPMLAAVLAVGAVKTLVIAPRTVSDTAGILEVFYTVRKSLPPLPPPMDYKTVALQLSEDRFDFLSTPNWAFNHSGGTLYLSEKSKLRLSLPMVLTAYEDLASGKVVLTGTEIGTKNIQTLLIADAPEFSPKDARISLDKYLMDELGPRRIIWTAVLKPEEEAWADLLRIQEESLAAPMMMTMSLPETITGFRIVQDGTNLSVNLPDEFVGATVSLKQSTNLIEDVWSTVLQTNVTTTGVVFLAHADIPDFVYETTISTNWVNCPNHDPMDPDPVCTNQTQVITTNQVAIGGGLVYYRTAAGSTVDSDGDGLDNVSEYALGTDYLNADTDDDGLPDGWEVQYGLNPLLYADGDGDLDRDGRTNLEEYLSETRPDDALPLSMGFENEESFSVGDLDNQFFWEASSGVQVQSNHCFSGSQAVELSSGQGLAVRELMTDAVVVTNEAMVFLSNCAGVPGTPPADSTSAVGYDPLHGLMAYDGTAEEWVFASGTAGLGNQWVRVKVVQNYTSKTWTLWINGAEKLTGLGFNNAGIGKLSSIHVEKGTMGTVFLDEISFSAN